MERTLLARQSILDRDLELYGYELLFRCDDSGRANFDDPDQATSDVLLNAFDELGIEQVVGPHRAFVNFTRRMILDPPPFSKERLVIEVVENLDYDEPLVAQLHELADQGYTIALDDFVFEEHLRRVVHAADIVKLDVLALEPRELETQVAALECFDVKLLAEKVETYECFERCQTLGFDLYQGFFFARPQSIKGGKLPSLKATVLELLIKLEQPDIAVPHLELIIGNDPVLSFKLLKLVNSAALRRAVGIESLQHAIAMLGLKQVRSFATLIAMTEMADKPYELSAMAVARGRMCQMLGEIVGGDIPAETYFTVGLLSTMDAFFDKPLKELLLALPLTELVRRSVLDRRGNAGLILNTAAANQEARWCDIDWSALDRVGVREGDVRCAYEASILWADQIGNAIHA